MKTTVLISFYMLLCSNASLAQLSGSDDFNDNNRDVTKWSIHAPRLGEINGRLEFTSTGSGDEEGIWAWIANEGSQDDNWSVTITTVNTATPAIGKFCGIGLYAINSADDSDSFGVLMAAEGEAGRLAGCLWETDGVENETWTPLTPSTVTLRISYNSSTGELSGEYDSGSGYSSITSFDCSNWTMGSGDAFYIAVFGISGNSFAVSSGQMYADNFLASSDSGGDDSYEENDTRAEAYYPGYDWEETWLSDMAGMGIQSDEDWYRIDVDSGFEHVVVTCLFAHAAGDIDIALWDSSGTELDYSDSITDNEVIDYVVPDAGVHYIQVYYEDMGNSYDLWWDDLSTSSGSSISNHLDFVFIVHTREYGTPYWSGDDHYGFDCYVDTDDSVTGVTLTTPGSEALVLTNTYDDGYGYLSWEYSINSISSLMSRFADGDYIVELAYDNGASDSTIVPLAQADGATPLGNPTTQPLFTAPMPLQGELFSSMDPSSPDVGITFQWGEPDPNANVVEIYRHHTGQDDYEGLGFFTEIVPWADGPLSTRSAGPVSFDPGAWAIEFFMENATYTNNTDGVLYLAMKQAFSEYSFTVLDATADEDGDGMPNWWETLYFNGPTNAIPSLDYDSDGHNNLQESITGMNPTNALSCFMITNCVPLLDDFLIEWPSVSGRVYTVLWSTNLTDGFLPLETGMDYPRNSSTDTVHAAEGSCFYKVEAQLQ